MDKILMKFSCVILSACVALTAMGCRDSTQETQFIEGIVLLDAKPVPDASVSLMPVETDVPVAFGKTDGTGKFTISVAEGGKVGHGAVEGDYHMTVVKKNMLNSPGDLFQKPRHDIESEDAPPMFKPEWDYQIPKVFENRDSSGLKVSVKKGVNTFVVSLKSDGTSQIQ